MNLAQLLSLLSQSNQVLTLGLEVGGVLVPIAKTIITDVKDALGGASVTLDFQTAVQTGESNLDQSISDFTESLNAVNAERAKLGLPPLEVPAP